jgi:hypothetical protein
VADPTLAEVLEEAADQLAGVAVHLAADGSLEYRIGDRVFAVFGAGGIAASFRLSRAVADAALRTPDTEPSSRGPEWVTLRASVPDDHALDRAVAWLESAARHARD